jgi:hypothetical protein
LSRKWRLAFSASGGQGALFEKTAPWTVKHLQKLLIKKKCQAKNINEKLLWGVQGGGFLEKSPPGRRRRKFFLLAIFC